MEHNTSDAIKLYGTEEPVEPMHTLQAGPLSCQFDMGALRFISIDGTEAIRNIAFVVRDKDWGTCQPELSNLDINQLSDSFVLRFDACCKDAQQELHYSATIAGNKDGGLSFEAKFNTPTGFVTNRTGFVVLHPVGVSGQSVTVEHTDGTIDTSCFPPLIDPLQPFKNIRALTHEVLPGTKLHCHMTGDTFEMEDHRQWNDASFKTYVRPISLPWPYTLPVGYAHQQSVELDISRDSAVQLMSDHKQDSDHCLITVDTKNNSLQMPIIGLGLEPQHLSDTNTCIPLLKRLSTQQLVLWFELNKHGKNELSEACKLADVADTKLVLHAVIPDEDHKLEIAALAELCRASEVALAAISVTPAMYLNSITPGAAWPDVTPLSTLYDEARHHFPGVVIGGGMLSFFPELNRHRPPTDHLDYVTHASNTITHACDDITVTENLESLPHIVQTCRSFANGKPYHVGPSSIGMRFNPYGSKTMDNPNNARIAMARIDPRQRGLLNAAWTVAYVAHLARAGVDCINLHAPTGEFGLIYHPQAWQQPGFDNTDKQIFPAFHPVSEFARATGLPLLPTTSSMSREIEAVTYLCEGIHIIWIANLSSDTHSVALQGIEADQMEIASLTLDTFDACTNDPLGFDQTGKKVSFEPIKLGPYSVVRLSIS
ncbi:MAG: hypothetical protein AB8B79_20715 [Granulosicoccus sp.]